MRFFRKLKGNILAAAMIGALAAGMVTGINSAVAMSRGDIAKISIDRSGDDFKYWQENAVAKQKLVEYVKAVTDEEGRDFIPVDDRIAVFDLDGTLLGNTTPTSFEWVVYLHRVFSDPAYWAPQNVRQDASLFEEGIADSSHMTKAIYTANVKDMYTVMGGLTLDQYNKVVQQAMAQPVHGLTNIKYGEEFYLPMAEVVSYLRANAFTVYLVANSHRQLVRTVVDGALPIKSNNIIGADVILRASHEKAQDPNLSMYDIYVYNAVFDDIMTTDIPLEMDNGVQKAQKMAREIGKKPVLSFGSSINDNSMHQYTRSNRKYRTLSFQVLPDDTEREYGKLEDAQKLRDDCNSNNWIAISMHDDWKTIYGEDVKKAVK